MLSSAVWCKTVTVVRNVFKARECVSEFELMLEFFRFLTGKYALVSLSFLVLSFFMLAPCVELGGLKILTKLVTGYLMKVSPSA